MILALASMHLSRGHSNYTFAMIYCALFWCSGIFQNGMQPCHAFFQNAMQPYVIKLVTKVTSILNYFLKHLE